MKRNLIVIALTVTVLWLAVTWPVSACEFTFNYRSIEAPLGTTGSIGVRVLKDHHDCSMEGMDGYFFEWEKIQVLSQSDWEEVSLNLFEKYFEVTLSQRGEGYFTIWKDCEREGYDEKVLPILVGEGGEEWRTAFESEYLLQGEERLHRVTGPYELSGNRLLIGEKTLILPGDFVRSPGLDESQDPIVVYFTGDDQPEVVFIVGEHLYFRFDRFE